MDEPKQAVARNAVFEKGSRLPEPCPPQAGCWCSRRERRPYVRLIVLGNEPRHASGLRTSDTGQTAGDLSPGNERLTLTAHVSLLGQLDHHRVERFLRDDSVSWPLPEVSSRSRASPAPTMTASPTPGVTRTFPARQKRICRAGDGCRSPIHPTGRLSTTKPDAGCSLETQRSGAGGANSRMSRWISMVSKLLRPDSFARSRSTFIEPVIGVSH